MKPYQIRHIIEQDLDELMLLIAEHAAYEQADYTSEGKKELLKRELFGNQDRLGCYVIVIEGKVHGYCSYTFDYSTWDAAIFVYMDCLFIRTPFRGMGIGSAILAKLKALANVTGCKNIQWQTPEFNVRAIAFYKRNGALAKHKIRFTLPSS